MSRYSDRPRDTAFMLWVKTRPCIVGEIALGWPVPDGKRTRCAGPIEADHMGARSVGRKADDRTCVPMCMQHHRERTDHSGVFRYANQAQLRDWRAAAMRHTLAQWNEPAICEDSACW